ncbi:MAG: DUF4199 domain-containing protein [Bacteroidia bacterium]
METKQTSILAPALIAGVIAAAACIIYSLILNAAIKGLPPKGTQYVSYLLLILVIFFATKQFREKKAEGFISYGKALGFGTLISGVTAVLYAPYMYIYMTFINPNLINQIMEQAQIKMANTPNMTPEAMDMAMKSIKIFTSPSVMAIITIVGFLFIGFIISLITAAILQKDKPVFETPDTQA